MAYLSVTFRAGNANEIVHDLLSEAGQHTQAMDIAEEVHRVARRRAGSCQWVACKNARRAIVVLDVKASIPGAFKLSVTINDPTGVSTLDRWLAKVQSHIV